MVYSLYFTAIIVFTVIVLNIQVMSESVQDKEISKKEWDLSEGEEYEDLESSDYDDADKNLVDTVEQLISEIKDLLRSDCNALELKEVPSYVSRKTIEDFFEISDNNAEVSDPNPNGKRDVTVYFYDKNLFCNALRKNGRQILSYTFDVVYNPNLRRPHARNPHGNHPGPKGPGRRGGGGHGGNMGQNSGGHHNKPRISQDARKQDMLGKGPNGYQKQRGGNMGGKPRNQTGMQQKLASSNRFDMLNE